MKDEMEDYLWDGSGEPDPEVERLEALLGRFRGDAPAPVMPTVPLVPQRPRRPYVPALVAAAALVVVGFGSGLWMTLGVKSPVGPTPGPGPEKVAIGTVAPDSKVNPGVAAPTPSTPDVARVKHESRAPRRRTVPAHSETAKADVEPTTVARHTAPRPLFDYDTASHIEQTELLLRTFMNTKVEAGQPATEIAYDRKRSRELLDRNVILRLGAEAKRNFPTEDILGSVEPYLLDIANLQENASPGEVRAIQERLQKREIVEDLQIYAMNGPKMGF
jgi:hypothetical protein